MSKLIRFSSSRTGIFQVGLTFSGLAFIYFSVQLLMISYEAREIIFSCLFILIAGLFIYIGMKLFSMKIYKDKIEFTNLFNRKIETNINDINLYGVNQFSISLVDPMKLNKFSIVSFKKGGKNKKVLILNPSVFSKHSDIWKLLKSVRDLHGAASSKPDFAKA